MEGRCHRHQFDSAVDRCLMCGNGFCTTCLVYPKGPSKPPYCLPCAVSAAGVRSGAGSGRRLSWRERRQLTKERKAALAASGGQPTTPAVEEAYDMDWMSKVS